MSLATVSDCGATVLLARCVGKVPHLQHLWADQGYRGREFLAWVRAETGVTIEVMQRKDGGLAVPGPRPTRHPARCPCSRLLLHRTARALLERGISAPTKACCRRL